MFKCCRKCLNVAKTIKCCRKCLKCCRKCSVPADAEANLEGQVLLAFHECFVERLHSRLARPLVAVGRLAPPDYLVQLPAKEKKGFTFGYIEDWKKEGHRQVKDLPLAT